MQSGEEKKSVDGKQFRLQLAPSPFNHRENLISGDAPELDIGDDFRLSDETLFFHPRVRFLFGCRLEIKAN